MTYTIGNVSNPALPDYRCDDYMTQEAIWKTCQDVKGGTRKLREFKSEYLPKFETESVDDYNTRIKMTWANEYYEQSLAEAVGMIFRRDPKLEKGADPQFDKWIENVDGKGTHLDVFLYDVAESAIDYGHSAILADYPAPPATGKRRTKRQAAVEKVQPIIRLVEAYEIVNWVPIIINGRIEIAQVTIEECSTQPDGAYGAKDELHWRTYKQEVIWDGNGIAVDLGQISWIIQRKSKAKSAKKDQYETIDEGKITGPTRIPLSIVYGGFKKKNTILVSKPFFFGLAQTTVEETQVKSDYANVMHKCNVPTPVFIGRSQQDKLRGSVKMGAGIDIPTGGDAKMLEPTGNAIPETRARLQDIQVQLRRQGAVIPEPNASRGATPATATEVTINSLQRQARLKRTARSLKDGAENSLRDVGSFLNIPPERCPKVDVIQDFDLPVKDPAYLQLIFMAWQAGMIPPDAALYALKNGQLPEGFDTESEAIKQLSRMKAVQDMMAQGKNPLDMGQGNYVPASGGNDNSGGAPAQGKVA